ncbi:MAG: hypothetical protein A2784_02095 [Candidatus Chisholmbacteria bacterium RIFCSPHIGHO2_01_FULL_48_12]|uniref:Glycosyltransferase RgtA/B/C/D-like domain-containing protein n=1 Tax=Candidatus Chisholmbacteria bacterium RIFCSPHIGHO2_01_FULL_48_12 TaxID=1797589 RepID=A0A1G1VKN7_9BACT|nr:MAG: hypothetical protein A2784_02095 [Candidatus Chisholmbacteria bacterium RIFCSPHIGHO2_01_FULL_48_12]
MDLQLLPWAQAWFHSEPREQISYYLFLGIIFIGYLILRLIFPATPPSRIPPAKSILPWKLWEISLVALSLIILLYNPNFRSTYASLGSFSRYEQFLHHNMFVGSINEIIHGKIPLIDTFNPYGILITVFPALIFSFLPFSYANFYLYLVAVHLIYYSLLYVLIRQLTRSRFLGWLGLVFIARLVFLRPWTGHDPLSIPSVTSFRFFWDIPLFLSLSRFNWLIFPINFLALLYNPETGLALSLATAVFFILKRQYADLLRLLFTALLAPVAYSVFTWAIVRQLPAWNQFIAHLQLSLHGFGTLPLPQFGAYWLVLAVYILALFWTARRPQPLLTTLAVYGLAIFPYYLGFSETEHLLAVSHPALIILIWNLSSYRLGKTVFLIGFLWLLVHSPGRLISLYRQRYTQSPGFLWSHARAGFILTDLPQDQFVTAAQTIAAKVPPHHRVAIISRYDTLLLIMAQRANLTSYYLHDVQLLSYPMVNQVISEIKTSHPEFIFADPVKQQSSVGQLIFQNLQNQLQWEQTSGMIDTYRWRQL